MKRNKNKTDNIFFDKRKEINLAKRASQEKNVYKRIILYKEYLAVYGEKGHYAKEIKDALGLLINKRSKRRFVLVLSFMLSVVIAIFLFYSSFFNITGSEIIWKNDKFGYFTDPRDNQVYNVIRIGNQIWMQENLNYKVEEGCLCYDNDEANCDKFGKLYTWDAAMKSPPPGWHIPSDEEWKELERNLGVPNGSLDIRGWRGEKTKSGKKLKTGNYWQKPNAGFLNSVNFSVLPGGYCYLDDSNEYIFERLNTYSYFWTNKSVNDNGICRGFYKDKNGIWRGVMKKESGLSVRCIKD